MKTLYIHWIFLIFSASFSKAGNFVGNGGDVVSAEFISVAVNSLNRIGKCGGVDADQKLVIESLKNVVRTASVYSENTVSLKNHEVDAVNFPSNKIIVVNRTRWSQFSELEKVLLVIHEYLWLTGRDDSDYKYSFRLIKLYQECGRFWFPVM